MKSSPVPVPFVWWRKELRLVGATHSVRDNGDYCTIVHARNLKYNDIQQVP